MEVEAASLNQIVDSDRHYKNDDKVVRAGQVDIRQVGNTQDSMLKGLFEFTWTSKSGTTESPRVVFQFLRPKGRLRPKSYLDYPVQMACTCKSFLYYGAQYYAVHGKYMYMPMFRPSLVPPVPQTMISRVRPGKGLNFKACKHVVAAYDWFEKQGLRILMHYRRYPEIGPPAKIMNVKEWERLMGFPFTLGEIQRRLSSRHPTLPKFFHTNFFRTKQQSAELNQWFQDTWLNRGEGEKIRVLETLVEHPEEIFYLLVKDAMEAPTKLSQAGIERAYDFMSRVVQPENDQEPEGKEYKRSGIPPIIPGAEPGQYGGPKLKEPKTTYKSVQPAIKDVEEAPAEEDMTPEEEKRLERFSPTKKKKKEKERPSWWRPPEPGKELPLKHVYQHKRRSKQAIDNVVAAYLSSLGA